MFSRPHHSVSLASPSGSIRENGGVVTFQNSRHYKTGRFLVNTVLISELIESEIESKLRLLVPVLPEDVVVLELIARVQEDDDLRVKDPDDLKVTYVQFSGIKRPSPDGHEDIVASRLHFLNVVGSVLLITQHFNNNQIYKYLSTIRYPSSSRLEAQISLLIFYQNQALLRSLEITQPYRFSLFSTQAGKASLYLIFT